MNCPECGVEADGQHVFCGNCGRQLVLNEMPVPQLNSTQEMGNRKVFLFAIGAVLVFAVFFVALFFWANQNKNKNAESNAVLREFILNLNNGNRQEALELMISNPAEKVANFINQASLKDLKTLAGNFEKGILLEDTPEMKLYETHPIDNEGQERTAKFKVLKTQDGQWRIEMN